MKRIELFEFEDFHWFPANIRTSMTNLIMVFHRMIGTSDVLSRLLSGLHKKHPFKEIVDLGSGSGGPMIETSQKLNASLEDAEIQLTLTDKYPNIHTVERINNQSIPGVRYESKSQDALKMEEHPDALKTMIASFHHMPPPVAKEILKTAERNKQSIFIYEIAENDVPTLLWWVLLPFSIMILILMTLFMTPFVKQLTLSQIVFTYVLPIIPIAYAWDGLASLMRTYTINDVKELIGAYDADSYIWEIEQVKKSNGKKAGYYIYGCPVK